jgi:threonine dehydratase
LGDRNVTEFNYRIADASKAHIFVGIATQKASDSQQIAKSFSKSGFDTIDLTHDELAKSHLRHMVGGRSHLAKDELLYRFEFPERPGALMKFLTSMAPNWNISLFHYRNHGADYGRILVGIQVPNNEKKDLKKFLAGLGYPHWDESNNPAYKLFLA